MEKNYLDIFAHLPKVFWSTMEATTKDAYNPTLYHYDTVWIVDWVSDEGDSIHHEEAEEINDVIQKAYDWAIANVKGFNWKEEDLKWIPTNERLPESGRKVLVIRNITIEGLVDGTFQKHELAYIDNNRWKLDSQEFCILPCTPTIDSGIITHWMPLPKEPSLENGDTK